MHKIYSSETNIYEHGIVVEGNVYLNTLKRIATTELPIYSSFNLSIVDHKNNSLNERAAKLAVIDGSHTQSDYYEEYDLRYCVLSSLYHLNRIIDLYTNLTEMFERQHPLGTALRGNTGDPRVYYEIDAFLGATRRIYESIIKVIWKHYYPKMTGRWSSIRKAVNSSLDKVPPLFAAILKESWDNFGEKLADYRNCIAHYIPLTENSNTTCWLNWYENRWGVTVKLPANPKAKSREKFDFNTGPEALIYCHSLTCHFVELCESLNSQTKIALYLSNPPH